MIFLSPNRIRVSFKNLTREDSRRPCSYQLNFVIWGPFCFLAAILFSQILSKFVQTVHTNFHAKSGLCSSRNERVMLNFAIWQPFCFFKFFQKLVSYAQFFDLAAILFFKILSKFVQTVHTKFHAKSGLCSSRNERVMLNFAIWRPLCFLKFLSKLVQTVHTNFQAKSGVCSSKND